MLIHPFVSFRLDENHPIDYRYRVDGLEDQEYDEELKWKYRLGILCYVCGKLPHEIYDDPYWNEHIVFDMDVAIDFFKNTLEPLLKR